jgi:hypothetical protein
MEAAEFSNLLLCDGPCMRSFHVTWLLCPGAPLPEADWKCADYVAL